MSLADLGAVQGLSVEDPLLAGIFALLPEVTIRRLFEDLDNVTLDGMVEEALQEDPEWESPRFGNYLVLDCPDGVDPRLVADAFQVLGIVVLAYPMPAPSDPAVVGTTNPLFVGQGYLGAAPTGVGVQAIWARGADGSNSRFVDLEQGWLLTHNDLPRGVPLLAGINRHSSFAHGCGVLGEIVGVDNTSGIVGMAPAALPRVISLFERANAPRRASGPPWRTGSSSPPGRCVAATCCCSRFRSTASSTASTRRCPSRPTWPVVTPSGWPPSSASSSSRPRATTRRTSTSSCATAARCSAGALPTSRTRARSWSAAAPRPRRTPTSRPRTSAPGSTAARGRRTS